MGVRRVLVIAAGLGAVLSCSRTTATPSPTPGTGPTTTAASTPSTQPAGGGQPGGPRARPSRDSLTKLRAVYVAQVMKQIAGHENESADQVFKNVQVLKGITAA